MMTYDIPAVIPVKDRVLAYWNRDHLENIWARDCVQRAVVDFANHDQKDFLKSLVANLNVFNLTDLQLMAVCLVFYGHCYKARVSAIIGARKEVGLVHCQKAVAHIKARAMTAKGERFPERARKARPGELPLGVFEHRNSQGVLFFRARVNVGGKRTSLGVHASVEAATREVNNFWEKHEMKNKKKYLASLRPPIPTIYDAEFGFLRERPFNLEKARLDDGEMLAVTLLFFARINPPRVKKILLKYAPSAAADVDGTVRSALGKICKFLVFREDDYEFLPPQQNNIVPSSRRDRIKRLKGRARAVAEVES